MPKNDWLATRSNGNRQFAENGENELIWAAISRRTNTLSSDFTSCVRVSVQYANGHTSTFAYDALGRLAGESDPLNHAKRSTYDAAGRPVSRTDAKGATTAYEYDGLGRLARIDYLAPDADVVYQYDAAGQRTDLQDGVGLTHWSYDGLSRTLSVTDPFSTMTRN